MTVKNLLHAIKPFDFVLNAGNNNVDFAVYAGNLKKNVKYCLSLRSKISLNIISEFSDSDLDHYAEDTGKAVPMAKIRLCFPELSATAILRDPSRGPSRKKTCPIIRLSCCVSIDFFSVHIDLYRGAEDTVLICNPVKIRNAPLKFFCNNITPSEPSRAPSSKNGRCKYAKYIMVILDRVR